MSTFQEWLSDTRQLVAILIGLGVLCSALIKFGVYINDLQTRIERCEETMNMHDHQGLYPPYKPTIEKPLP